MGISRRRFLQAAAFSSIVSNAEGAASEDSQRVMPTRVLGRTEARVSILGIGTGPTATREIEEEYIAELVAGALDRGITYVDTAVVYGEGKSERAVGEVLKSRRRQVWLATKIQDRNYDNILRMAEESLRRLQTDQVDLLHIHNLGKAEDLAAIEAPRGPLEAFYRLRDQKVTRFIGITSHTDPGVLKEALERHDFDCVQLSLNAAHSGAAASLDYSFEKIALPVAVRKNMGILAMKVFVGGQLARHAPDGQLLRYSLSLPIAAAVVGMPSLDLVEQNIRLGKAFEPLPDSEMKNLPEHLGRTFRATLDRFFRAHEDA